MKRRIPRPKRVPTMVAMALNPSYEAAELVALIALRNGTATAAQFDVLIDCRNMLALGANRQNADDIAAVAELASIAIGNIRDRWTRSGKLGATGDELQAFHTMIDVSQDFWRRQGGGVFAECHHKLTAWCNSQGNQRQSVPSITVK